MADAVDGGEPPIGSIPPAGNGLGPNPLTELPMSNVTGFCTINERGIGWVRMGDAFEGV